MNTDYHVVYPADFWITAEQAMIRANDYFADGEITEKPENPDHAIELLQDIGVITIAN